ncbi:MAG: single-stranded-DNA-specific exonuclease RecJ [Candidatus Aminicenantes bacterium]|nr:single-stranded-DNA-specific exonuclease RecJ [Candidatus Aminicenantes bacterium]
MVDMDETIWQLVPPGEQAERLAREMGIPVPIARILENRGIRHPEEATDFLHGSLGDLPEPSLMKDMDRAVKRIHEAIGRREKILIFGDYDADGVLSVVMLLTALRSLGAEVDYYIPDRLREGYGIKEEHMRTVLERKASLVISVDCGIKAIAFARKARREGVDVIITDHHRPGEALPDVTALLNPVLKDSGYPHKNLAGVGVVFKLLQALLTAAGKEAVLSHYVKLVAIGTIADVAELRGENRILVRQGLKGLGNISNRGLRRLMDSCGLNKKIISEGDVGFRIAPRINAAGRMETADLAVRLFFARTEEESAAFVRRLEDLNAARQSEEEKITGDAFRRIKEAGLVDRYKVLILGCEAWHRGVIGIVASKIKDAFYRPVVLFTYDGQRAFGSGRSISEFSLIECLDECREFFQDYGGHTLAAGCVLPAERVEPLKIKINALAQARLSDGDIRRKIWVDVRLDFSDITIPFLEHFFRLAPFGVGNPRPVFLTEEVEILDPPQVLQDRHLKLLVRQEDRTFEAMGWDKGGWVDKFSRGDRVRLVYALQVSPFLGEERINLSIEDVKS